MVKCFLERVKAVDEKYVFQDVVLTRFEQGRDTAKNTKHVWVKLVSEAVPTRLKNHSSPASKLSPIILYMEGWKNSDTNLALKQSCHYTSIFKCSWSELGSTRFSHCYLEQWPSLCNYTVMYLSPED